MCQFRVPECAIWQRWWSKEFCMWKMRENMHLFSESTLWHKSKFSRIFYIYVSDTELLQMYMFHIIFRRDINSTSRLNVLYFDKICKLSRGPLPSQWLLAQATSVLCALNVFSHIDLSCFSFPPGLNFSDHLLLRASPILTWSSQTAVMA